ncbi:MAG: hypothetical protein H5T62_05385 [Anaerolineae bacterium]|nr:hypothetical protein [Anaerolineae bacterium]
MLEGLRSESGQNVTITAHVVLVLMTLLGLGLGLRAISARDAQGAGVSSNLAGLVDQGTIHMMSTGYLQMNSAPSVANAASDAKTAITVTVAGPMDVLVSQTGGAGVEGVVNLSVFGPDNWTSYGDAFVPLYSNSSYTPNPYWDELEGKYTFRIRVPSDYASPEIQVEILDPDCYNAPDPGDDRVEVEYVLTGEKRLRRVSTHCSDRRDGCLVPTQDPCENPQTGEPCNPYWFLRMDENRERFGRPDSYVPAVNTTTRYTLYYLDISNTRHDIASYTKGGEDGDADTDLQWVTPEGFRFQLSDYPDVAVAEDGSRSFFLEVEPTAGSSENGFDLWAGPVSTYPVPQEVNQRNVYLLREGLDHHDAGGVVITALGYVPLNANTSSAFTWTLSYVPAGWAGAEVSVHSFDNDYPILGQNLDFYLEGVPDFFVDGVLSGQNEWVMNRFQIPENFSGGYLWASYDTTQYDTSTWKLEYQLEVVVEVSRYDMFLPLMLKNWYESVPESSRHHEMFLPLMLKDWQE